VSEGQTLRDLEAERQWLLGRYDHYALPPAIYARIRQIETELAWAKHRGKGIGEQLRGIK
jgi:hypothetical protein